MTRVENLIVEGRFFFPMEIKEYTKLKKLITEFMDIKGYISMEGNDFFFQNRFLSMTFMKKLSTTKTPLSLKFKKLLGLMSDYEIHQKQHYHSLEFSRREIPFSIIFYIIPDVLKDQKGLSVQIRSEPVILFQIRQMGLKPVIDEFIYSDIIETNRQCILEIMFGMGGTIIEKPKAIAENIQTPFIDVLRNLGLESISALLKKGSSKIERGDIEDGLTDLRSALEQFLKEMVNRINEKPTSNIPSNLDILKKNEYIDEHLHSIIKDTLYDWIYRHISDKSVHRREKINIYEAKLLFSISELIMNYLLEKVVYRR